MWARAHTRPLQAVVQNVPDAMGLVLAYQAADNDAQTSLLHLGAHARASDLTRLAQAALTSPRWGAARALAYGGMNRICMVLAVHHQRSRRSGVRQQPPRV